jgi:CDP-paratose 2-epimerase
VPTAIITGSGGLVGSESVRHFVEAGYDVIGLDNDMRARFFGPDATTTGVTEALSERYSEFRALDVDIRDIERIERIFAEQADQLSIVVHAAAQPSHDWAATDPQTDFTVNANGTLNLLECTRRYAPDATFVYLSTNKVYGDLANELPLVELETRLELPEDHPWSRGIDDRPLDPFPVRCLEGGRRSSGPGVVAAFAAFSFSPARGSRLQLEHRTVALATAADCREPACRRSRRC